MTDKGRKKRRRRIFVVVLVAAVLLGVYLSIYRPPSGPIRITISRETTHILGPVNEDGTVNYVAYLNAKHSKGVTTENNAAIPLIEIFGPDLLPKDTDGEIYKILKIEPPAEDGKYFVALDDYIEKTLSNEDAEAWEDEHDLDKVTTKPWKPKQYPVIAEWLKANDDALDAMPVAMQRTDYYMPTGSLGPDESMVSLSLPNVRSCLDMGNALAARAMLKLDSGDAPGAWVDLMSARHLARRVGSGYSLIESLVAIAIETTACSGCRAMAGSEKLTDTQARAFLIDMQRLGPLPDLVDTIDKAERFFMLDCVMMLARATYQGGLVGLRDALDNMDGTGEQQADPPTTAPRGGSLEWDKILLKMNPWYDSFVAAARQRTFKTRTEALAAHDLRSEELSVSVYKSRSFLHSVLKHFRDPTDEIGDILVSLLLPSISRTVVLRDRGTVEGDLSVVAMALAVYRAEKKAYPDKLSELAPGYLKKVPDDLFIDKPFGYKQTEKGYLLYSVGKNMKYDGEKKKEDDEDGEKDDIVVRVE
ncbi:MAG: hypothetical protein QGH60_21545 [Phycisphaerae bacterium]|jgi:hypothetical protein|nr:hypothetical protein [Phycisphaerae bacterium]